ncbi:tandem-95 repeat protein [Tenacibaculum jejuense]|uniref:Cadherin domain-containing protein n=1 Tax=Tenacibaculum jejuense TaxID=584609 RepID=A0A238UA24_9FLAO|nr:tandem-95 repeat protein [Tenacibaculum jejuense]SNR15925.1 Protein of unknown function precursor containing a C-terminal secretion signal. Putative adhesin [Tenacibaculum jejuense]
MKKKYLIFFIALIVNITNIFGQNITIEQQDMSSSFQSNVGQGQIFTVTKKSIINNIIVYSSENIGYNAYFKLVQGPNNRILHETEVFINPNPNETKINISETLILEPGVQYAYIICSSMNCDSGIIKTFKAGCSYPDGELYGNGYAISDLDDDVFDSNASFNHCDLSFIINLTNIIITDEDTPVSIPNPLDDIIGNYSFDSINSNIPSDRITVDNGILQVNSDNTFVFSPELNFNGRVSIPYVISDTNGLTKTSSIEIFVLAIEDIPEAIEDNYMVDEDNSLVLNPLLNDKDGDGDSLIITTINNERFIEGVISLDNGSISINEDNSILFVPSINFNGIVTIPYEITDNSGLTSFSNINISVNPVNDIPVANNDFIELSEGSSISLLGNNEMTILHNDTDVENNKLTTLLVSEPSYGSLILNTDGTFTYQHDGSDTTSDKFMYKIFDGDLESNVATVDIIINPINDNFPTSIILSNKNIQENIFKVIGEFSTVDLDLPNDNHSFELVSGTGDDDNSSFTINNNELLNNALFDYELQQVLSIRVKVTDGNNQSFEKVFQVEVINANDINIVTKKNNSFCSGNSGGTGSISIVDVSNTSGMLTYEWSAINGGIVPLEQINSQNLNGLPNGTYILSLSDAYHTYTESFDINLIPQYNELSICYVTSDDSEKTKNRIYLNNENNYNVAFYEILRESNVSNVYTVIGTIASNENSFLDDTSNNLSQPYNYKVRLIDNCGNVSTNSSNHKSILLQSNVAVDGSVNLNWSDYEGTNFSTYKIYRNKNQEGIQEIASVSSNINSFNDIDADTTNNSYEYYISVFVEGCFTETLNRSINITEIKSNYQSLGKTLSINDYHSELKLSSVYPNPAIESLNIRISNSIIFIKGEIYNTLGQKIMVIKEKEFSISEIPSSTYFIKIYTSKGIITRNFIKK